MFVYHNCTLRFALLLHRVCAVYGQSPVEDI